MVLIPKNICKYADGFGKCKIKPRVFFKLFRADCPYTLCFGQSNCDIANREFKREQDKVNYER